MAWGSGIPAWLAYMCSPALPISNLGCTLSIWECIATDLDPPCDLWALTEPSSWWMALAIRSLVSQSEVLYLPEVSSTVANAFWWWSSSALDGRDFLQNPRNLHCDLSTGASHQPCTLFSPTKDGSSTIGSPRLYGSSVRPLSQTWSFCWALSNSGCYSKFTAF